MPSLQILSRKGWRRTGCINIALSLGCGFLLLSCLIYFRIKSGSPFRRATIIYEGKCDDTSRLNTILHLLINLFSTGILASSHYFMQVVSSPSRKEIDRAHTFYRSLDIAIPSVKNLGSVSYFKRFSWLVLLFSSFPIHLFFNSVIFATSFQGSDWQITIATEAFTQGADFYNPGASLAPAGSPYPAFQYDAKYKRYRDPVIHNSSNRQRISNAAENGSGWDILDAQSCRAEYLSCNSRSQYRDVVIVIETSTNDATGWKRNDVFNLSHNLSQLWDAYVPPDKINSLWYSASCHITRRLKYDYMQRECYHDCRAPLSELPSPDWELTFHNMLSLETIEAYQKDYEYDYYQFSNLTVKYCLAEPHPQAICKIELSNLLLLIVIICTFIKSFQCTIIIWKLRHPSLVTLGDALESFITRPDHQTRNLTSLDITDSWRLETRRRRYWYPNNTSNLVAEVKARRWRYSNRRVKSLISRTEWAKPYGFISFSFIALMVALIASLQSNDFQLLGLDSFGHSNENRVTKLGAGGYNEYLTPLLLSNVPQLLLSFCYFSYNALFTRLQVEKEWNSYSLVPQPLRVSYPKGEQVSSFRLQLPYRYGIPLLFASALGHWFLSNAVFIFIIEGDYWMPYDSTDRTYFDRSYFDISENSIVSLGYSPIAVLFLFIFTFVLIPLPFFFSLRKLKGKMIAGGSNSLVLSAACHCYIPPPSESQAQPSPPSNDETDNSEYRERKLREMSVSKLRWGVTPLPSHLAEEVNDGEIVMHLGFSDELDNVTTPTEGKCYL
ncbi:hypothetical protein F4821DRAFT_279952 [Hypoxylon rubiginosum]|uniref:Uncharacterized protein n=1 Tax=Hypoxylon rubiginosum TaxID=110542 RepID=A0ACC0CWB3_9PEZI|nr:hypothetical protein F4821DRAFT_279952 [Hypoxylon rubiginosum]